MENLEELKIIACDYRVLYVEDDEEISTSIITYLSKFFYDVVHAKNGEEGLTLYKEGTFDLVISDIQMPKMSGLEMAAEIKAINEYQNILIISAYAEIENFITSIKLGIDGYIIKPVNYVDMNKILYKVVLKIKAFKDNEVYEKKNRELLDTLTQTNNELKQFVNIMNKVAIVSKTDAEGNITYVNDFFCEVTGYLKEDVIGQTHRIIRHIDMSKSVYDDMWKQLKNGKVWEGNLKNRTKYNDFYYSHVTIFPLFDVDQETIIEYIGISFLTTKDEVEKRKFKKNVMNTYQDYKKRRQYDNERIQSLDKELSKMQEQNEYLQTSLISSKEKQKKSLKQIEYLEYELSKINNQHHQALRAKNETLRKTIDKYNKALSKIDAQLNSGDDEKNKIIKDLEKKVNKQKEFIKQLKKENDNRNDKKAESLLKKFM